MNPNKVYESIIKLLFNVVRTDELKYHLLKDKKYLEMFVELVNDLLSLELDEKITYKDKQWARTFGKAIVLISQEKQRFIKNEKNLDKVYEDYSQFISFTNNEYKIQNLDSTTINFTQDDVIDDSKLSQDKIKFFEEKEAAAQQAANQDKDVAVVAGAGSNKDSENQNQTNNQQQQNNGFNPFMGNGAANLQAMIPPHPATDPRFYPYTKKQKWFPAIKIFVGVLVLCVTLLLAVVQILVIALPIQMPDDLTAGLAGWPVGDHIKGIDTIGELTGSINILATNQGSTWMILSIIIWFALGAMMGYSLLKKPRTYKEKYRISYFYLIPILIIVVMFISGFFVVLDPNALKSRWLATFSFYVSKDTANSKEFINSFNEWWTFIYQAKHVAVLQGLVIGGISASAALLALIIGIMIAQPRIDRQKMAHANNEYQMAVAAAMQGKKYEIDPSLFDDGEADIINKKSKFKLWWEKKSKNKSKDHQEDN